MMKPIHPNNRGLREPKKVWVKEDQIYLADLDSNEEVSLQTIVNAWNKSLKDLESVGCRVVEGPTFRSDSYYGRGNKLVFTYEQDNVAYETEKAEWDNALAVYQQELAAWKAFDEERKQALSSVQVKSIDAQIERTERRLANLKAVRAGEPLPYPKG